MQIPAGLLGDRFGRRRILILGLLGGALAAGLTGLAGSLVTLFLARALTGAFQGSLFSNDRAIIATVTPPDRIGLGQGVSFSGPGLGLTFGLVVGGLLVEILPWRTVMMLFGLGPIIAAVLIARYAGAAAALDASAGPPASAQSLLQRIPLRARAREPAPSAISSSWRRGRRCSSPRSVSPTSAAPALRGAAGSRGLAGHDRQRLGARPSRRAGLCVEERDRRRLGGLAVSMLAMAGSSFSDRSRAWPVLFVAAFFCWSIWGAVYTLLARMVRPDELGTAFGFSNISFIGAIVGPTATGWVRDFTSSFAPGCVLAAILGLRRRGAGDRSSRAAAGHTAAVPSISSRKSRNSPLTTIKVLAGTHRERLRCELRPRPAGARSG
jgi:MFS family permease